MNKGTSLFLAGMLTVVLGLAVGCDWSSSSDDSSFNTSQGGGSTVNVSGFYEGALAGGQAVSAGTSIRNFTVVQSGNAVDIYDSNGSHYSGNIGAPGAVAEANDNNVYPAGAEMVQYQISFSGFDVISQRDVEFVGIIHLVAVNDVQGDSEIYSTSTSASQGSSSSTSRGSGTTNTVTDFEGTTNFVSESDNVTKTVTTTKNDNPYTITSEGYSVLPGQTVETTEFIQPYQNGGQMVQTTVKIYDSVTSQMVYSATTTNITDETIGESIDDDQSASSRGDSEEEVSTSSSSRNQESYDENSSGWTNTVVENVTYQITEATSQLRLEGTWMFKDGNTAQVDALGPGAGGTITESSTTTTESSGTE